LGGHSDIRHAITSLCVERLRVGLATYHDCPHGFYLGGNRIGKRRCADAVRRFPEWTGLGESHVPPDQHACGEQRHVPGDVWGPERLVDNDPVRVNLRTVLHDPARGRRHPHDRGDDRWSDPECRPGDVHGDKQYSVRSVNAEGHELAILRGTAWRPCKTTSALVRCQKIPAPFRRTEIRPFHPCEEGGR
jgi:hypothetical protein